MNDREIMDKVMSDSLIKNHLDLSGSSVTVYTNYILIAMSDCIKLARQDEREKIKKKEKADYGELEQKKVK